MFVCYDNKICFASCNNQIRVTSLIEATGVFLDKTGAEKHLDARTKKAIISNASCPQTAWLDHKNLHLCPSHLSCLLH